MFQSKFFFRLSVVSVYGVLYRLILSCSGNNCMNYYITECPLLEVTLALRCCREEALALLTFISVCRRRSSTRPRRPGVANAPAFFLRFSSIFRSSRT